MAYYGMLRRVALVRTDVSEELSASFIKVTRIGEIGTLAVTSNRSTLGKNTKSIFEISMAVTMKNGVVRGVTPRGSCRSRRFGRT
jgi:hypothetical protein